jgi:hypothetical protein
MSEQQTFSVTYAETRYYTKQFEAKTKEEALDKASEDWCEVGDWNDTQSPDVGMHDVAQL